MITFAVPFEESTALLERTLGSVLGQTAAGWKLLVCDDGVDPLTKPQVESLNDPRVQYVKNTSHLGTIANANQCLDLATTELVTLLRAGDLLLPHYAEHMESALANSENAVAAFCRATKSEMAWCIPRFFKRLFKPLSKRPTALKNERALEFLRKKGHVVGPTACYRKPVLGSYRFTLGKNQQELWTRLVEAGHTVLYTPETAYSLRSKVPKDTGWETSSSRSASGAHALLKERFKGPLISQP